MHMDGEVQVRFSFRHILHSHHIFHRLQKNTCPACATTTFQRSVGRMAGNRDGHSVVCVCVVSQSEQVTTLTVGQHTSSLSISFTQAGKSSQPYAVPRARLIGTKAPAAHQRRPSVSSRARALRWFTSQGAPKNVCPQILTPSSHPTPTNTVRHRIGAAMMGQGGS